MPITADKSMIAIGGRDLPFTLTSEIAIRKTNMQVPITSKDIGAAKHVGYAKERG